LDKRTKELAVLPDKELAELSEKGKKKKEEKEEKEIKDIRGKHHVE